MRAQGGLSSEWKGVKAKAGAALAEARVGAKIAKQPPT
jgi:hypothetical protein